LYLFVHFFGLDRKQLQQFILAAIEVTSKGEVSWGIIKISRAKLFGTYI